MILITMELTTSVMLQIWSRVLSLEYATTHYMQFRLFVGCYYQEAMII